MQRAKAFFFVCAGVFLLALAYHFGALNARAQGTGQFVGVTRLGGAGFYGWAVIDRSGQVYEERGDQVWHPAWSVPGVPVAIYSSPADGRQVFVLLENGDIYFGHSTNGPWPPVFFGNILGAPTPLQRSTFGSLKAHYR